MAAPKAPMLDASGKKTKDVTLESAVFGVDVKPHLIHETVRAEAAASRSGSSSTKSRGLVQGGRAKPWRQKGTGRARAGTTRSPIWVGGGHTFALQPRSYELKVNRKARKAALRGALAAHASRGSLAVLDASGWSEPSTKAAAAFLADWDKELPILVVAQPDEQGLIRSFRNLKRVLVVEPSEVEVGALVWARSLLATETALQRMQEVAA